MAETAIWYRVSPDGDVYPHILACPPMIAVVAVRSDGSALCRERSGCYPVDRSVYGRNWNPFPQDFVRLLEMASGRRMIDWMRMEPRVGVTPQKDSATQR